MSAAEAGSAEAVAALLEAGAPWNATDDDGYCAGDYAGASGNPAVVEMLLDWGVRCEELLGAVQRQQEAATAAAEGQGEQQQQEKEQQQQQQQQDGGGYLAQKLVYTDDGTKLLDADGEAVMMGWELPLMVEHAAAVTRAGGDVLNVGFGLGLVDEEIQKRKPRTHTIIEAHPDVHARMLELGWDRRPGVKIVFGRWQDVLPALPDASFDGVFFDTYGDYYDGKDGIAAFHRALPRLVRPGGVYSFFNGFAR
jgi:protein arginine N-methyltransferase 2